MAAAPRRAPASTAPPTNRETNMATSLPVLLNSLLYAGIGILVFVVGFIILDMLTPGKLWEEINDKQ
ncbi:MAG: DUF350 domain-containing protein, partial [Allosphingosinicella sp.]